MRNDNILITNIQRFSLHDGPGIRTTIFLKGCLLHCPWCSNPENIRQKIQEYVLDGKKNVFGRYISCDDIYLEIIKDKIYYDNGGITYSGGEPLLQMEQLEPIMQRLKSEKIHQCIETSLFAPISMLSIAIKYIDMFYVDIKVLDKSRCKEIMKGSLDSYQKNLEILFDTKLPVIFRIPIIVPYTTNSQNIELTLELLERYKPICVELIKGHNLGNEKYNSLKLMSINVPDISDQFLNRYK